MSLTTRTMSTEDFEFDTRYRALSTSAVASLVVGVISVVTILNWALGLIPIVGILLGVYALLRIQANRDELTGGRLAVVGIAFSALFLAGGWGWHRYVYLTEVPDGFRRISYERLQPDPNASDQLYPPSADELDGERVFIKGFVYPGAQTTDIKQFVLCRDNGSCCFGGNPRLTDRIRVTLKGPLVLDYSTRMFSVAGTFHVQPSDAIDRMPGAVVYHLDAEYLK